MRAQRTCATVFMIVSPTYDVCMLQIYEFTTLHADLQDCAALQGQVHKTPHTALSGEQLPQHAHYR